MALLSSKAIVGADETYRLISEGQVDIENAKREVVADLINAASEVIENAIQGPVIIRQFSEYYYGDPMGTSYGGWLPPYGRRPSGDYPYWNNRLILENRPVVYDVDDYPILLRTRVSGDALTQSGAGWETWTIDGDFILNTSRGLITLNPAEQEMFLTGFRNVYVEYYAGYGVQELDDEDEVITSTAPEPLKMACKKLVEAWWRNSVVEFSQTYVENVNRRGSMAVPEDVWALLRPYVNRRPFAWAVH